MTDGNREGGGYQMQERIQTSRGVTSPSHASRRHRSGKCFCAVSSHTRNGAWASPAATTSVSPGQRPGPSCRSGSGHILPAWGTASRSRSACTRPRKKTHPHQRRFTPSNATPLATQQESSHFWEDTYERGQYELKQSFVLLWRTFLRDLWAELGME